MSNDVLVGSTGFVGGNLMASHAFGLAVHSSDVAQSFGTSPDLCVYAGVPSAMFLANRDPEADLAIMKEARQNLRQIAPKRVVLVSTIAVYDDSRKKDEDALIDDSQLTAYGRDRLQLERWVREDHDNATIVRLPALFGQGIKKNFIKDMISITPPLLTEGKYAELSPISQIVRDSYAPRGDGFYAVRPEADTARLREWFSHNDFNALSFTDSRSRFQFFGLDRLWEAIVWALDKDFAALNLATPPVSAAELYRFIRDADWTNDLNGTPFDYDMRTMHMPLDTGEPGYLCTLEQELEAVREFVAKEESCLH